MARCERQLLRPLGETDQRSVRRFQADGRSFSQVCAWCPGRRLPAARKAGHRHLRCRSGVRADVAGGAWVTGGAGSGGRARRRCAYRPHLARGSARRPGAGIARLAGGAGVETAWTTLVLVPLGYERRAISRRQRCRSRHHQARPPVPPLPPGPAAPPLLPVQSQVAPLPPLPPCCPGPPWPPSPPWLPGPDWVATTSCCLGATRESLGCP